MLQLLLLGSVEESFTNRLSTRTRGNPLDLFSQIPTFLSAPLFSFAEFRYTLGPVFPLFCSDMPAGSKLRGVVSFPDATNPNKTASDCISSSGSFLPQRSRQSRVSKICIRTPSWIVSISNRINFLGDCEDIMFDSKSTSSSDGIGLPLLDRVLRSGRVCSLPSR